MEPLIRGQGVPPSRSGDSVLICTALWLVALKQGDLVWVELPKNDLGSGDTIRRIKSIVPGRPTRYELEALAEMGIDSRHLGLFERTQIRGKILHIFRAEDSQPPNQSVQHNAGSRPSSGDSAASDSPSLLGPRG